MGILAIAVPLIAHHGTGVAYDTEKVVTLKGTVTEWIWANPHCGLLFDVTDDKGNIVHWGAELTNPHALSKACFRKRVRVGQFGTPMHYVALVVRHIEQKPTMWVGPDPFGNGPLQRDDFLRVVGNTRPVVCDQWDCYCQNAHDHRF